MIIISQVYKLINPFLAAFLIVLPVIGAFITVPLGLINIIKSYNNKEPFHRYRLLYLIGHLFFLLLLIALFVSVFSDISKFSAE